MQGEKMDRTAAILRYFVMCYHSWCADIEMIAYILVSPRHFAVL